ncbi:hypothetical protein HDU96_007285 [Phlyctochytrium bullatum]|nr:hypothetical protein HDU96_007285 [Phlyctochytrium bullatum]
MATTDHESQFWAALDANDLPTLHTLLATTTLPLETPRNNLIPLQTACLSNRPYLVTALLAHGVDPDVPNTPGTLPIQLTSSPTIWSLLSRHTSATLPLLRDLRHAAASADDVALRLLLSWEPDPAAAAAARVPYTKEYPSLAYFAWTRDATLLHLAKAGGAVTPRRTTTTAGPPLHRAVKASGGGEVVRVLLARSADVTARGNSGWSPLHVGGGAMGCCRGAAGAGRWRRCCWRAGAELDARDWGRRTPLLKALEQGSVNVAAMLVERGADVNARGRDGSTPLHEAARLGDLRLVQMLVGRGAEAEVLDRKGRTALECVNREEKMDVYDFLESRRVWKKRGCGFGRRG